MQKSDPFPKNGDDDRTVIRIKPRDHGRQGQESTTGRSKEPTQGEHRPLNVDGNVSNSFVAKARSLLSIVAKMRNLSVHHDISRLHQRLTAEMRLFESRTMQDGVPENQINHATYILCALIDETVMNTLWGSKGGWGQRSLSIHFTGEDWGGLKFFEILSQLKKQPAHNLDLLELFYLCLSLGFQGIYRNTANGLQTIESERQDLFLLIQSVKGGSERTLSSNWRGMRDLRNPLGRQMPLWVFALVAGAVMILAYLGIKYTFNRTLQPVNDKLTNISHNVQPVQIGQRNWSQIRRISPKESFERLLAREIEENMVQVLDGPVLRITDAFPSAHAEIRLEFHEMLEKIAAELQENEYSIQVIGHTDQRRPKFSAKFTNLALSRARAENVANLLNKNDSLGDRISWEGKAAFEPVINENTKEAWAVNRRVDIYIR